MNEISNAHNITPHGEIDLAWAEIHTSWDQPRSQSPSFCSKPPVRCCSCGWQPTLVPTLSLFTQQTCLQCFSFVRTTLLLSLFVTQLLILCVCLWICVRVCAFSCISCVASLIAYLPHYLITSYSVFVSGGVFLHVVLACTSLLRPQAGAVQRGWRSEGPPTRPHSLWPRRESERERETQRKSETHTHTHTLNATKVLPQSFRFVDCTNKLWFKIQDSR